MRTSMRSIVAALAVLALAAPPKDLSHAKADGLVRTGKRQIVSGEFAPGIAALEEAHETTLEPELLLEIAAAYDEWGEHCGAALDAFRRFFEACEKCAALEKAKSDYGLV